MPSRSCPADSKKDSTIEKEPPEKSAPRPLRPERIRVSNRLPVGKAHPAGQKISKTEKASEKAGYAEALSRSFEINVECVHPQKKISKITV
jgi:hypothetical protein